MHFCQDSSPPSKRIIVEDYRLFSHKAQQQAGSDMEASRVIGTLETFAIMWNVPITKQPSSILSVAVIQSGIKMTGDHASSHWKSAYNHGYYWLLKNNIIKSRMFD